jgi:Uma2 family endonuclease
MATSPQARDSVTLDEFLRLPEIDEHPYLEFIDGEVEAKVSPQKKHSLLQKRLSQRIDDFAGPRGLGSTFVELRCTFGGRSIVPDLVFLREEHIEVDDQGEPVDVTPIPPDIHIEIISPDQSVTKAHRKLVHSTAHGCDLGILVHPYRKTIDVYRPGRTPERLADDGAIDFDLVLPGLCIPVAEIFGWLVYRRPDPGAPPA